MAAKASLRLFTPWGARSVQRVTKVLSLALPFSLFEPMPVPLAHEALSWMGGRARAPPASSRSAAPPLPLRGSATAESSPPLHWGEVAFSLGVDASVIPTEG
jgi:hypothetical protein